MSEKVMELQHQVRNNSEELQDFLRDLGSWTKQMEQKDEQLRNKKASREINKPQSERLRSVDELKRKSPANGKSTEISSIESEKKTRFGDSTIQTKNTISSYDYDAWSKFDVEKALEDIEESKDEENNLAKNSELSPEILLQKAVVEKEKGNEHFKAGRYKKAIDCYTNGMKCDPKNAVLPANRAMAKLKLKEWNSVESDCTLSISLDKCYVKAYQRRGTARKALKKYQDALKDFEKILELEPNNKQAVAEIQEVQYLMKQQQQQTEEQQNWRPENEVIRDKKVMFEDNIKGAFAQSAPIRAQIPKSKATIIPGQVFPIEKPPHKRSTLPLKKIEIKEIGDDDIAEIELKLPHHTDSSNTDVIRTTKIEPEKKTVIEIIESSELHSNIQTENSTPKINQSNIAVFKSKSSGIAKKMENEFNESIKTMTSGRPREVPTEMENISPTTSKNFKKPTTSVQFTNVWTKFNKLEEQIGYLELFSEKDYAKIFKHSMEPVVFSSILFVLQKMDKVSAHLYGISQIPRISAIIMFLEDEEKSIVDSLLKKAKLEAALSSTEMAKICQVLK